MDPVGLTVGLISTVAALAFKLHQLIAESEIAGDQFEDLVCEFKLTSSGLQRLNSILARSTLPDASISEYRSHAKDLKSILECVKIDLQRIQNRLNSPSFWTRYSQKRDLIDGDLRRLTSKMSGINSSLILLATTYSYIQSDDRFTKLESEMKEMGVRAKNSQNINLYQFVQVDVDINLEYVQAAMKVQQEDEEQSRCHSTKESEQSVSILNDSTPRSIPVPTIETVAQYPDPLGEFLKEQDDGWNQCAYSTSTKPSESGLGPNTTANDSTPRSIAVPDIKTIAQYSYLLDEIEKSCDDEWARFTASKPSGPASRSEMTANGSTPLSVPTVGTQKAHGEGWSCAYSVVSGLSEFASDSRVTANDLTPRSISVSMDLNASQDEAFQCSDWYAMCGLEGASKLQEDAWVGFGMAIV